RELLLRRLDGGLRRARSGRGVRVGLPVRHARGSRRERRAHEAGGGGMNPARLNSAVQTNTVIEDYVKTIYHHTEWQPEPITPSVLAARLGLAASSVTEMVKKLSVSGLVNHVPYGA